MGKDYSMEYEAQDQVISVAQGDGMGFWAKFVNIFVNPQKTFIELDQRPTWLVPLIIMVLLTLIITYITFPIIIQSQLEMLRSNPNISAEQLRAIEQQLGERIATQKYIGLAAQLIIIPVIFFLLAGIFYFVGSVILGGDSTYRRVLAVWTWSSLIGIVAAIVRVPLVFIKQNVRFSISPALLLPGDAVDSTLYTILSQFDFFLIWQLAVFAFGFGLIYKFSTTKAYVTVGVLWGIWIVIAVVGSDFFKGLGMM
jgi:hypothetical protein